MHLFVGHDFFFMSRIQSLKCLSVGALLAVGWFLAVTDPPLFLVDSTDVCEVVDCGVCNSECVLESTVEEVERSN